MKQQMKNLFADLRGVAVIEFALALPVLLTFIFGIFQIGLIFQANSGVQHALGQAARHATIWPTPSDDDIKALLKKSDFGTHNGILEEAVVTTDSSKKFKTISVSYSQPTEFIFFEGPTVNINKSKRVYIAD